MSTAITALRVLDEVAAHQPVGVTDLSRRLDMPKSSTQRALKALESSGWIRQTSHAPKGWVLTTKAIDVAQRVAADVGVREAAREILEELRDETGESTHLAIREHDHVVITDVVETTNPTRIHIPVGTRSPLHATATGKAILAHLDEAVRGDLLRPGLARLTEHTITDPNALLRELADIRLRGSVATAKGELRDDIASIAAPVLSPGGAPLCAVSVFIPAYRFPADDGEHIRQLLRSAAQRIAQRL